MSRRSAALAICLFFNPILSVIAIGQTDTWNGGNGNWSGPSFGTQGIPNFFTGNSRLQASTAKLNLRPSTSTLNFARLTLVNPFRSAVLSRPNWLFPTSLSETSRRLNGSGSIGLWSGVYRRETEHGLSLPD
jgi:hypothetical protein